jgi:adenine deaminase
MTMSHKSVLPQKTQADMRALMQVALGEEQADLTILNAKLVNVYTAEVQEQVGVAVKGPWIARVSADVGDTIGAETRVIDAGGRTLIPGLIDGHTHLSWICSAAAFVPYAIASGVTTVVTETLEPYPVAGIAGVLDLLASLQDQPIRILATAPSMVSISTAARGVSPAALESLLAREDILGLGESYWQGVLQEPDVYLPAYAQTLRAGKVIEGHSAGASEKKLAAYAAAGVSSCHEPINAEQVRTRLRLGMHVMVREGSIRRDLEEISKIRLLGLDLRRLILASDGASPEDLMRRRYMDHVVQKAIGCGFSPVTAIQMATLNVAEHFRLDGFLGAIAPGRLADVVIIPDVATIAPEVVIANGRVIFENGRVLAEGRRHLFSEASRNTVKLTRDQAPADFRIRTPAGSCTVRVRVIEMVTDLVTAERQMDFPAEGSDLRADPTQGICKIAAVDRTRSPGKTFTGLIQGFGLTSGAVACSAAWDTSDIVVVGTDDGDMALAVNRLRTLQGGAVLCDKGMVLAEIPMPVFGIASEAPMPTIVAQMQDLTQHIARLGVPFPDPLLSLITLTGAAIPYLRICEEGLVNLKDGTTLGLFVT